MSADVNKGVKLWWRDDDAGRAHERLDRLLRMAVETGMPVALAVVPAWLEADVARLLNETASDYGLITILQHGWAHEDHAAAGQKKIELGGTVLLDFHREHMREGRRNLEQAFGKIFLPLMTPPWNRIDEAHLSLLAELGYSGLSAFATGPEPSKSQNLARFDTHLDVIDWRDNKRLKTVEAVIDELDKLIARGCRSVGLLTHHLEHGEQDFLELERLVRHLSGRRDVSAVSINDLAESSLERQSSANTGSASLISDR